MTRGILPVVALLVIASTFSQFSGHSGAVLSTVASSAQQHSAASETPERANTPTGSVKVNTRNNADCKELTPCIPRSELGPWNASCEFAVAQGIREKSPEAVIDLGSPLDDQLKSAAASAHAIDPLLTKTEPGPTPAADRWCLGTLGIGQTHTVIVTLPDPVRSHLALDFDRRVDAIQSAALKAGYVLDHFWLPWTGIRTEPSQNPDLKSGERVLQQVRLSEPGLEVFRSERLGPGNRSDLIFVFLVGETPTSGIDLGQLQKAIQYGSELKAEGAPDVGTVKLLGPSFSGSIPALIDFLTSKSAESKHPHFNIVASTATDHDLLSSLAKAVPGGDAWAVVHDDAVALNAMAEYARSTLGIPANETAIISESETAYGQGANSSKNAPDIGRKFHFPREIYRLRTVYPDAQPISPSQRPEELPNAGLNFSLKVSPGGDDSVPSFSREELPLSQEAELLNVAESIHRDKIKLAGVLATDVFDTLFMLRFLHEFCPDTRLFVVDSDVLFIRAATNYSLEGTLAVTNYRLSSTEFPSRNAEITYNAFLALIDRTDEVSDEYQLQTGTQEGGASEPPLWLAVLSTNGLQPVHVFPELHSTARAASDGNSPVSNALPLVSRSSPRTTPQWHESTIGIGRGPETRKPPDAHFPSGPDLGIGYLLFAITAAQIACAFAGLRPTAKFLNWLIEFFHVPAHADAQKACFISISFFVLAILNIFVFFPIWRIANLAESGASNAPYTLLAEFGAIAVFGSLCMSAAFFIRHQVVWTKSEKLLGGVSFATLVCYLVTWMALCWFSSDSGFILQRSLDLSNGVSPLTPNLLALMVLYLWSLAHIRRIHLWEARRQSIAFTWLDRKYKSAFSGLESDLSNDFQALTPGLSLRMIGLGGMLAVIVLSAKPREHLAGFESSTLWSFNVFDYLYLTYICLCAVLLAWALVRFILGWSALLNILRRLERQPIRHAFDRLPKKFYSWTPLWHSGGARRTFALQTRALECFEKLWSYRDAAGFPLAAKAEVENSLKPLRDATSDLLKAEAEGMLDTSAQNAKCRAVFLTAADNITRDLLIPHWEANGDSESIEQHEKDQAEKPDKGVRHVFQEKHPPLNPNEFIVVAEEFVALRFVGFMRYVGVQLRNMLSFVVAGFILCVASIRSYPFLAHRTIGWGLTVVFVVLGIPVVIAFAQMDKDAILSRLSDTDPGKLDRAFYARLIAYGGLPFLTVLASQFPAIGRFLFSWVQPAIEALH